MPQIDNNSPFALTGTGQVLQLTQPGGGIYPGQSPPAWVLIQNDSSLQLAWSTSSDTGTIQAWSKDVIQLSGTGGGSGVQRLTITTSGFGSGTMAVTWSNDGDPLPSSYPSTSGVSASAIAAQAAILLDKVFSATTWAFTTPVCPPGAIGLMVAYTGISATGITVTGSTSGFLYGPSFSLAADPVFLPYNSTADPQLNVAGTSGGAGGNLEVYALFAASGAIGYGASVGGGNAPMPPWAELIAGQYLGTIAPLQTDVNGRLVPLVPTAVAAAVVASAGSVLAAPVTGAWYLFGWDVLGIAAQSIYLSSSAAGATASILSLLSVAVAGAVANSPPLGPLRITTGVWKFNFTSGQNDYVVLRYAPGP